MKKKVSLILSIIMCISIWIGDINFIQAAENTLNKDTWTQGTDGKWRKIVDISGWDFESMESGIYTPTTNTDGLKGTSGLFWNSGGGNPNITVDTGSFEIKSLDTNNKALYFKADNLAYNTICYYLPVHNNFISTENNSYYELNYKINFSNPNASIALQKGPNEAPDQINITNNFEGTQQLTEKVIEKGNLFIKLWSGPPLSEFTIDYLELVMVTENDMSGFTAKESLFAEKDNIKPLNSGNFEKWTSNTPPAISDFIQTQGVEIVNDGYRGSKSAKIPNGKELILKIDERLEYNTEYTIFFAAKTSATNKLEFRLTGFKNKNKFDYAYNDVTTNMYNWLENLKISTTIWKTFRYDFTTSDTSKTVQAKFKSNGGDAFVDTIFIVKKSDLAETTYTLPTNDEMSKGHRLLIDNGLQFQSWIPTDKAAENRWVTAPTIEKINDMGLTAVQYNDSPNFSKTLHEQNPNLKWATAWGPRGTHISGIVQDNSDGKNTGSPTEEEWKNGFLNSDNGLNYVNNLISMCIGDEENYSDTLTQNVKSWFEVIREKYPNVIVHHNEVGNTATATEIKDTIPSFGINMLRKYVRTAKPDMITNDMYYFRERRVEQTVGGTVLQFYNDLSRYRTVANEGIDGTSEQPIPFGQYNYSWRTGPGGGRGDGWYEMTESQINLYAFATWTFGGKWMSNFRWLDENTAYLFNDSETNPNGTAKPYHIYDQFKEMVRQSKNLGPHLTRLINKSVAVVSGKNNLNGSVVTNGRPVDIPAWTTSVTGNNGVFINNIQVTNLGKQNSGLNGDVFISYFDQLKGLTDEDKRVFTSTDPKYFMILNGLTAGDGLPAEIQQGSSYETRQEIKITFSGIPSNAKLMKVSRVDGGNTFAEQGKVVEVPLNGNTMTTVIGGGYADLYYWELGDKNTTTITQIANESGKEELITGQTKYTNDLSTKDLGGRTIIVGNITGTNDIVPEPRMGVNITKPANATDGQVVTLTNSDIPFISTRYFTRDIWDFRVRSIQKDNNVNLVFNTYNWTKEQLLQNIQTVKDGGIVANMPDILVVPDSWLWDINGLISNDAVLPINQINSDVIDLTAEKWNQAYTQMSTKDGNTFSAFTDVSINPIGLFVNKRMIDSIMGTNQAVTYYNLQKQDKWTFTQLNEIIDKAISNNISSNGKKLFSDNDYFLRQLLASSGVTDPYNFDANSTEYKMAIGLYNKLKDNDLLMLGTLQEQMAAFQAKELMFIVAPYTEIAKHLSTEYVYYEDNTTIKNGTYKGWGPYSYTAPTNENLWQATVRVRPAGEYSMNVADWNFMLFPKVTEADEYKAILHNASIPVIPSSTVNPEDIAIIWDRLAQKYKGVGSTGDLFNRGGEDYPDGRFWEPLYGDTSRDIDTIRKVGLRDGYGDLFKATGVWDNVLAQAIKDNIDETTINELVSNYLGITNGSTLKITDKSTTLKSSIEDANAVLADPSATVNKIIETISNLADAIEQFGNKNN